ncbi:MAG TPA: wax ester/triacylglycerol synthase family O-acyltransferase [Candidatus Nanopelagicales bacterium]|nr:wax ester/triacylglycerol synthase family O-acyltransferase [Candidatus Nanopelagicales bacterium]
MSGRRPVGPVDTLWLRADHPTNLMVIDSLMWVEGRIDVDRLKAVVQHRMVDRFPVFHQRLAPDATLVLPNQWEDDPGFSLDRHVHVVELDEPGDDAVLAAYVESQMHVAFDREHPLWEVHVLQGHRDGAALFARFHHALADGIALVAVLLSLTDEEPDADLLDLDHPERAAVNRLVLPGFGSVTRLAGQAASLMRPSVVRDAAVLTRQTLHVADKLLLSSLPESPLAGEPGIEKRAVWSQPHDLAAVKKIGRGADATVNDVLVAAVSGAIGDYAEEKGVPRHDITTMVPVNMRDLTKPLPRELGNRFALAMLPLPSGVGPVQERLAASKARMDAIKASPEALITYSIITAIGMTQRVVEDLMVGFFSSKAIGVTTNVRGPATTRYLAGSRIIGALGWVPGSGNQTLGVCIFSYDGTVRIGFKSDATVLPDPEILVQAFDAGLDDMAAGRH